MNRILTSKINVASERTFRSHEAANAKEHKRRSGEILSVSARGSEINL